MKENFAPIRIFRSFFLSERASRYRPSRNLLVLQTEVRNVGCTDFCRLWPPDDATAARGHNSRHHPHLHNSVIDRIRNLGTKVQSALPTLPLPHSPTPQFLIEPLSQRELDVLRLLNTELSGPEIARELVVALSTVRTHTKRIYSKLNVTNRRAAVKRAAELDLI